MVAAHITDAVTSELASLGTVSVASRTSAAQYTGEVRAVTEIAKALRVDYVIEASAVPTGDHVRVVARLVDAVRDRKVWVGEYDLKPSEIPVLSRRIATEVAAAATRHKAANEP
jgi:adenylate cyclase